MAEGWVLDAHLDRDLEQMALWLLLDDGRVRRVDIKWTPSIHVHAEKKRLEELRRALARPEYQIPFGPYELTLQKKRLDLEDEVKRDVLSIRMTRPGRLAKLAETIDGTGNWGRLSLYSVDPKFTQRFLSDLGTHPFGRVKLESGEIIPLDGRADIDWLMPPLNIIELEVDCSDEHGHRTAKAAIQSITIKPLSRLTRQDTPVAMVSITGYGAEMIGSLNGIIHRLNPDIIVTKGGDIVDMPALIRLAKQVGIPLQLGRSGHDSTPRTKARTAWSYGRLIRKEAYHALEGRIHIDISGSFLVREGGIEGLIELSRLSGLSAQDLSRLSPGSAISAMQMRQAMDDGVLVPWKKNRPEDLKNGLELLRADRGGLYLQPRIGIHKNVVEIDFASLFPSIIATRNISPETMGCNCCDPEHLGEGRADDGRLPIDITRAAEIIQNRNYNRNQHRNLPRNKPQRRNKHTNKHTNQPKKQLKNQTKNQYHNKIRCKDVGERKIHTNLKNQNIENQQTPSPPPKTSNGENTNLRNRHTGNTNLGIIPKQPRGEAWAGLVNPNGQRQHGRPESESDCAEVSAESVGLEKLRLKVPGLGLHTCTLRHGFLGRVVAPIIERRRQLKLQRRESGDEADRRQNVLKWILVTCFGYTGYRNARFGRIECHEAICAWSREILLQTIEEAQREGFDPLHAIVDSLWLKDLENRNDAERDAAIQRLVDRVEARIGVPLDIEDTYGWIAFLPNRTNGSAALTKYFGIGSAGWKIRGIELRQHSTCEWVRRLQRDSLEILRENPTDEAQREVVAHLHEQLQLLRTAVVDLADLIVARRVRREVADARTENLTTAALRRAEKLQRRIPPGHKAHFAVVGWRRRDLGNRVRLKSEIDSNAKSVVGQFGDAEYYAPLAVRAVSAILSPFGWSDERIGEGAFKQSSLDAW